MIKTKGSKPMQAITTATTPGGRGTAYAVPRPALPECEQLCTLKDVENDLNSVLQIAQNLENRIGVVRERIIGSMPESGDKPLEPTANCGVIRSYHDCLCQIQSVLVGVQSELGRIESVVL